MNPWWAAYLPSKPRRPFKEARDAYLSNFPPPLHPPMPWSIPNRNPDGSCAMCCQIIAEIIHDPEVQEYDRLQCCCCGKILIPFEVILADRPKLFKKRIQHIHYRRSKGVLPRAERMADPVYRQHLKEAAIERGRKRREEREKNSLSKNER